MTAAWLLYVLLVGGLLAAAADGVERACRLAARSARFVWAAALLVTVALAASAPFRMAPAATTMANVTVVHETRAPLPAAARSPLDALLGSLRSAAAGAVRPVELALASAASRVPAGAARGVAWLWALASLVLAGALVLVQLRFRRARRAWPAAEILGTPVRVAEAAGPAVVGLVRPEIVVPRWLLDRSAEEQRLVLAHEREHVAARDPLLLAAACATVALMPWHPAAWWMLSRLRLAVELDCDGRVLRRGAARHRYGSLLIDLAQHSAGLPLGAAALGGHTTSHLERRILAMHPKRQLFPRAKATLLGSAALLLAAAACESRMPTNADVANMDVRSAQLGAEQIHMKTMSDSLATFTVDGRTVTAAEAHAIPANEIATIQVRHTAEDAHGAITIVTRKAAGLPAVAPGTEPVRMKVYQTIGDGAQPIDMASEHEKMRSGKFDGVVVIDGMRSTPAALSALAPNDIVSVDIMKGPAAMKEYNAPEAVNGVIKIVTKKGAAKQ